MKKLTTILFALALLPFAATAATQNFYFSGTGVGSTTLSYLAIPGTYGLPRVQYLNTTSDLSNSVVKLYKSGAAIVATAPSTNGTSVVNAPGTGNVASNDVIVVWSPTTGAIERLVVSSVAAGTITTSGTLVYDHPTGSTVYKMTSAGTIPVGAATKELNAQGGAIWNGQSRLPLLLEVNGTSACSLNSVSGQYDPNAP